MSAKISLFRRAWDALITSSKSIPCAAISPRRQPDSNGRSQLELCGVQASFDTESVPLLYVGFNQINLQIPHEALSGEILQVTTPFGSLPPIRLPINGSLSIFRAADGTAVALNEDLSVNSKSNPAKPGSIISLFVNGLNVAFPPIDGGIAADAGPVTLPALATVTVIGDGKPTLTGILRGSSTGTNRRRFAG